jgi:hypothetical protein
LPFSTSLDHTNMWQLTAYSGPASTMSVDPRPIVAFCPYLPLHRAFEFAEFWIGPIDSFTGAWEPPELEHAVRRLLTRFVAVGGQPIMRPSLIATRKGPVVDGKPPTDHEALAHAVAVATLVGNPRHPDAEQDDAWKVVTADNCDLWIQPIDLHMSRIALERGSRVRTLAAGYRFSDEKFVVPPPLELHSEGGGSFDPDIAEAVFQVISAPDATTAPDLAGRLRQAVRWWVKSRRNSPSLSWEDRIVHLRIAVDALVGSDRTSSAVRWLNELFSSANETDSDDLLWAGGHGSFERTWGGIHRRRRCSQPSIIGSAPSPTCETRSSTAAERVRSSTTCRDHRTPGCSSMSPTE